MSLPNNESIAVALREQNDLFVGKSDEPSAFDILVAHAGVVLFDERMIGPREMIVTSALDVVRSLPDFEGMPPDQLVEHFRRELLAEAHRFVQEPESWTDDADAHVDEFRLSFRRSFGVSAKDANKLIFKFHAAPEHRRLGIFMLLEHSKGFPYLTEVIDHAEGEPEIEDPMSAMRAMLKTVWTD